MIRWWSDPSLAGTPAGDALHSLDTVFALHGEQLTWSPLSYVHRLSLGGRVCYVKRYVGDRADPRRSWFGLRTLIAPLRVEQEWKNLQAFSRWGLPTPRLLAYGLERRNGRFVRGALVTEEIPHTQDLGSLARTGDARLKDRSWVTEVSRQLAAATRTLHRAGFAHNDLKWRNVLVDRQEPPQLHFIDCPNGAFWGGPFLRHRIIKDLACLDKVAKSAVSRSQRLRFYLDYRQHARLTPADKAQVRKVLAYFEGRE